MQFQKPVFVLGAGATKDCGGPMTDEILPLAFGGLDPRDREDMVHKLGLFLRDYFRVPYQQRAIDPKKDRHIFPSIALLMSILDTAIEANRPWQRIPPDQLSDVRVCLDYVILQ